MPTTEKATRGPGKKPPAQKRTSKLEFRVSPAERRVIEGHAEYHGLKLSEYLRRRAMAVTPLPAGPRPPIPAPAPRPERPPDWRSSGGRAAIEARVRRENPGMPDHSVRVLVSRELQRG